ncbi:hypothetical protein [uncultured Gammaproteobacteria bacterium]|jgi:hypothetical protein|uniref:Uncharacterized protein n=2 Tax=sulfur-oxidizing symbionts TaxID=32036 RepID=A0ACA8ZQR0_9GAMM|nr:MULTISPECIES: hypothetical protein [sulfur-oxidizing symbionts]CAC9428286.1 hypothetical protein [uncultured Gammaproteobacteria bacterium]CAB5495262.1 hypothetical protein AZO1586R_209 [Bathymodiolus azoricus thioautotrophic gill symbiont]CAB5500905.1 hypothetical protein AZO1586I_719 [Bathymodiolus thermophilus thioautotrophic gill symbiont]CAC9499927.1 hypothetical protein [uncultured Gammaproteobacteria bacterium]CAC9529897.1 hypothetical protein [uncultured Gammaproteobacteria bacteriu
MKEGVIQDYYSAIGIIKIILPFLIIIEILKYFNLIIEISIVVYPLTSLLNLPVEFGMVLLLGLLTGVYGGVSSFFLLINPETVTTAEVTTLASFILISHALPIEAKISSYLGVEYWKIILFRIISAIIFSSLLTSIFSFFNLFQEKISVINIITVMGENSIQNILIGPFILCLEIGVIIILLHRLVFILKKWGVIVYLEKSLSPITRILKINKDISFSLLIGVLLGISYGGALLKKDFQEKSNISKEDKKKSIYFLNLMHSIIEDTVLVLLIGANIFIVVIGRLLFSISVLLMLNLYWTHSIQKNPTKSSN